MPMPWPALCSTTTAWPCADELAHAARHEADAIFEDLDLFRDADAHGISRIGCEDGTQAPRDRSRAPVRRIPVAKVYDSRLILAYAAPALRPCGACARTRAQGDHDGPCRTHDPGPGRDEAHLARRILDAVHAEPRVQGRSADGRARRRDVPVERPRRQDHRRVVGAVLRLRRPRPQGDRRRGRRAVAGARFLRAVPARASEAVRARDARRRVDARRSQPDLLRQLRFRVGRHGDEGRARLPPGARPGRAQHVRVARARLSRRRLRRRRAVGPRQQPPQVRAGAAGRRAHAAHASQGKLFHAGRRRARRRARRGSASAS